MLKPGYIAIGHLYLSETAADDLAGIPSLWKTRDGGGAPATAYP